MPEAIRFDSHGRIIIEDAELAQRIIDWMQQGKELTLRVPFPSPPMALIVSEVVGPGPQISLIPPRPVPIPMLSQLDVRLSGLQDQGAG